MLSGIGHVGSAVHDTREEAPVGDCVCSRDGPRTMVVHAVQLVQLNLLC